MNARGRTLSFDNDPRFIVVDTFALDGRRYFLICERPNLSALSKRERQALALCAKGLSSKDIAVELEICFSTARVLLARAARKLGVMKTGEAAMLYAKLESTLPDCPAPDQEAPSPKETNREPDDSSLERSAGVSRHRAARGGPGDR